MCKCGSGFFFPQQLFTGFVCHEYNQNELYFNCSLWSFFFFFFLHRTAMRGERRAEWSGKKLIFIVFGKRKDDMWLCHQRSETVSVFDLWPYFIRRDHHITMKKTSSLLSPLVRTEIDSSNCEELNKQWYCHVESIHWPAVNRIGNSIDWHRANSLIYGELYMQLYWLAWSQFTDSRRIV